MLTIHQLQVFVTIADHRSIRRAAEQLVVTQPAVSASLAALERSVGVELVARHGRGIELTEAGRVMVRYARVMLGLVDEAIAATKFADDPVTAPVRVGATTASADHMLMPLLARIRTHRPAMQFNLEVGNRARVWQLLADRQVDIAVTTRPPANGAFESLATRNNEFVLVAKPGSVWAGKLGEATWLVREEGSSSRSATDEVIAMLGISPPTLAIGSNAAIQRSAEAGLGVALLPAEAVVGAIKTRSLATIRAEATPLRKPWHVVARAGETLSSAARQFIDDLVNIGGEFEFTPVGATLVQRGSR
ncbi:MAG: LysR family transcriptional regulator [Acidimicrobiaceae bacterium]|nr:MAG: LysR family transcriptional regulator [Acidimicrobiaceae bacterium]